MTVINMNCLEGMRHLLAPNSVDSIVTDPPYELGFMGKEWDASGIAYSVEMWREALRILKPGGHLLAFSGARTYLRMVCAIEDAGFEIRDQILWVYGSGFPKSLDVSKAIDKAAGAERQKILIPTKQGNTRGKFGVTFSTETHAGFTDMSEPVTDAARQWDGWGTALKPAHEPIVVARKPLIGTVAANVLAYGTGAINIDGCRVDSGGVTESSARAGGGAGHEAANKIGRKYGDGLGGVIAEAHPLGRWPANLIHDGSDEVLAAFPQAPGQLADESRSAPSAKTSKVYGAMKRQGEPSQDSDNTGPVGFKMKPGARRLDEGSAARFFYCAKASKSDRGEGNTHPTVKPTDLMRYLCRLVTPPGGLVLDPFAGSGSTGRAARLEGFQFLGFELSAEYTDIANRRRVA